MQPSSMYFVTGGWYLFSARVGDELVEVATIHWFDDALEVEWISTASTPELCATLSALLVRGIEGRYGVGQRPVNVVVWDEGRVVPEKVIEATRGARLLALTEGVEERFDVNVNGSMSRLTGLHWHDELRRFDVCDRAGAERYQPSEAALLGALRIAYSITSVLTADRPAIFPSGPGEIGRLLNRRSLRLARGMNTGESPACVR